MIELKHVFKTFHNKKKNGTAVHAVEDVSISIDKGEIFGIIGFSGAGKSTLVRCINLLERPTAGSVQVHGKDMLSLSARELRKERRKIGMIFQHFNLLKSRTVSANVEFALKYTGLSKEERARRVQELSELVEISDKALSYPSELSGGQKQRVAIARALANKPDILLCDEATSALDPTTTKSILALLKRLNKQLGLTIVIITHQMDVIKGICDRVAVMEKGRIIEQGQVFKVFANPQEEATKNFIRTTSHLAKIDDLLAENREVAPLAEGEKLCRFTFLEKTVSEPLISALAVEFGIVANIVFADIEIVQGSPIGGTVAIVSGNEKQVQAAFDYLRERNVGVEVLKNA